MSRRDHLRARQASGGCQRGDVESDEVGHEQEEAAATGGKAARCERELLDVGDGLDGGLRPRQTFFVEAAGQSGKAFLAQDLAHGSGAEAKPLVAEGLADFVDGVILLAQGEDAVASGGLFGLVLGSRVGGQEELRVGVAPELMAQDAEGAWGIAEVAGHLLGGSALEEVGAKGLIDALFRVAGLGEELSTLS